MRFPCLFRAACLVSLSLAPMAGAEDSVTKWNSYLREAMKRDSDHSNPGYAARSMAMMNGAIYDCFQAIRRTHQPLHVDRTASPTANRAAAAAAAAYPIAKELYPAETFFLTWSYRYSVDPIPDSPEKAAGIALGEAVAAQYLAWRANDGYDSNVPYTPGTGPGKWRPDPDFFPVQTALGPEWGALLPFVLSDSQQFQPPPVPALTSPEYTAAFHEVLAYGADDSTVRTPEQLQIGQFWAYDRSGMGPPPVHFNQNISQICLQRGTGEEANARLFALASVAMADAAICAWDAKFADNFWRPVTAIREADTDGNPDTQMNPEWKPYGVPGGGLFPNFTPPFPSYVSGHASMGGSVFQILKTFYGMDATSFGLTSDEVPGVTRYFKTFSQAAQENADSRVWLGVHWRFDQTAGQVLGEQIADFVAANAFQPLLETYADFAGVHGLGTDGNADFDKDGFSNFAEYAFSTHPCVPDSPPGVTIEQAGGVPTLTLRYMRQPARTAAGLTLIPQVSTALSDWSTVGLTDLPDPTQTSTTVMEYRCACIPITPASPVFLRMKAQM